VSQFVVYGLDQPNTIAQRRVQHVGGFVLEVVKVIQAADPVAFLAKIALMTSLAGCLEQAVVWTVPLIDDFQDQQLRIRKCFNQLSPHDRLL
jgi:hypothetical protein